MAIDLNLALCYHIIVETERGKKMKATGIVRRLDDLGRVVVPRELRHTLKLKEGDAIEFYTSGDTICIKKYYDSCSCCGASEVKLVNPFNPNKRGFTTYPEPPDFFLCEKCIKRIKNVFSERGETVLNEILTKE